MGSGGVMVKSSMEAMLDSLMRREEKPRDVPPALPPRPPSRGRLPSARRSLPPLRFNSSEENLVTDPSLLATEADVLVVGEKEKEKEKVEKMEVDTAVEEEEEKEEVEKLEDDAIVEKEKEKEKEEVYSRALKAEKELKEKEEEVAALRQQLAKFESKCSDYETQLRHLQDQLALQQQQAVCIQVRRENGVNGHDYNNQVQGNKQRRQSSEDAKANPVGQLMSEFENKKRSFEEDAKVISQWKPGQPGSGSNPVEDLLKLKFQFTAWKRDFKVRLHDTKVSLEKMVGKSKRNCWAGMKWIKQ